MSQAYVLKSRVLEEEQEEERKGSALPFLFSIFLVSRLFFFAVGALADSFLPHLLSSHPYKPDVSGFDIWGRLDGVRYMVIAALGYSFDFTNTAFFPLYPLLMRLFLEVFGGYPVIWGVLISLVGSAFAFYFIFEIARELYGERVARIAIICFAFFPTAFFLNAVYTEGLFLALSAGSIWAARVKRNFLLGCILAALAATTRNLGFLLVIPLALEWYSHREKLGWRWVWLALPPSGLAAYMGYLWWKFSDPLLSYKAQATWGRELHNPLDTVGAAISQAYAGFPQLLDLGTLFFDQRDSDPGERAQAAVYFVIVAIFVLLLIVGIRLLPKGLWLYSLLLVLVPEISVNYDEALQSAGRFVLQAFPIFFVLGVLFLRRPRVRTFPLWLWLLASVVLGAFETALFASGRQVL